jgi:hypothetical protein
VEDIGIIFSQNTRLDIIICTHSRNAHAHFQKKEGDGGGGGQDYIKIHFYRRMMAG